MIKKLTSLAIALFFTVFTYAQYQTVNYDPEKNYFNEGQPLPAEQPLMFTGQIPEDVDVIEISIFPAKAKNDKDLLYLATWKDLLDNTTQNYSLAVNYALRASTQYDFRIDFYRRMDKAAQAALAGQIADQANAYLNANIIVKNNQLTTARSPKRMVAEMEALIHEALADYRNQNDDGFEGLSSTVRQQLDNLDRVTIGQLKADSTASRGQMIMRKVEELKAVVDADIRQLMNQPWSQLAISRYVDDYETERKKGFFSLSVGYGGVYIDGPLDDFTYGDAPYLGIAFPLSNSSIAPKFLRNSSVVIGAFLDNFEDDEGDKISGLVVGRPFYLGLDYKLFEFVRFNAGAAFLEETETVRNGEQGFDTNKKALVRPFVGLSARIDLSVRLGK